MESCDSERERLDAKTMTWLMRLGVKAQKFLELKSKLTLVGAGRAKTGKTKMEV
ncbi:MAG: hypothetical protein MO853_12180 [Candidatus Protistobacter heckmanni]|nr:hypothetical protein [Candidatus Protistobacter heckmanni]